MKIFATLGILLMMCGTARSQSVVIGAGSTSGTSSNGATGDSGPIYRSSATSSFIYSRHHYLYTQAELAAAGLPSGATITKISWNKDNGAASNAPYSFEIWLKNSSLTAVQPPPQSWAMVTTGATNVFNNTAMTLPAATGYVDHNLSTTFSYTGGALEISVAYDHSSGSSPWTTLGISWKKDPISNRTISYVGSSASTNLSNARTVRPQIKITYTTGPCTTPPTAGTATTTAASVCSGAPVSIGLTGNSTGTGQTYQLQSASTATGPWTNVGTTQTSASATLNPTATLWYRYVVTCGSASQGSQAVQVAVPPLFAAGTYTINNNAPASATNFQSFTAAVNALSCGIAGPVVMQAVAGSGPYVEQVTVPAIGNTSAINTVTFNCNNVVLTTGSTSGTNGILTLNGSEFVTVKKLQIQNTLSSNVFGILLTNDANRNLIDSCTINMGMTASSSSVAGLVVGGSATGATTASTACDSNMLSNNTVIGGYYCVTNVGGSTAPQMNNQFIRNTIRDYYVYGLYMNYNTGTQVIGNDLHRLNRTSVSTFYGIVLSTGMLSTNVRNNRIHNPFTSSTSSTTVYGLYNSNTGASGSENIFANNLLYNMDGPSGTQYLLYALGAYVKYYHNTIVSDHASGSGSTYGYYRTSTKLGVEIRDNIFVISRGGSGTRYAIYMSSGVGTTLLNHNNYYLTNGANTGYNGTLQSSLAAWKAATNQDQSSVSVNPGFVSAPAGNLAPSNLALNNLGAALASVPTDILGQPRSTTTPDMGAYEFPVIPVTLNGPTALCTGSSGTYIGGPAGGSFTTSNALIATVSSTGVVNAVQTGSATITYSNSYGSASVTVAVTATPAAPAAISGPNAVCSGTTITLSNATSGGVWSSSNTSVATVSPGGVVSGLTVGSAVISYTKINGSCSAAVTKTISVVSPPAIPAVITGQTITCMGNSTLLSSVTPGGTWSSNNPSVASVSASGLVTGNAVGTAVVTYTVGNGTCTSSVSDTVTVNAQAVAPAPITGTSTLCAGTSTLLANANASGFWSSSNQSIATVDQNGLVTAVGPGSVTISYVVGSSGCSALSTKQITVNPAPPVPGAITGNANICTASPVQLASNVPGGMWISANPGVAVVNSIGLVSGIAAGSTTITYLLSIGACSTSAVLPVQVGVSPQAPAPISGPNTLCTGNVITLANLTPGGSWSSSNTGTALIGNTGIVTGQMPGTVNITYAVTSGFCSSASAHLLTVHATPQQPPAISGSSNLCAGSTAQLSNAMVGGSWASSAPAIVTVSPTGLITGVAPGTALLSYSISNGNCVAAATKQITVTAGQPVYLAGNATICPGDSSTLVATVPGGTWSSLQPGVASVDAAGVLTGLQPGTTTISYTVSGGCTSTAALIATVVPAPVTPVLSGNTEGCLGTTNTLTTSASGGYWTSNNTSVAVVGYVTGLVTPIAPGSATITYTVANAGCSRTGDAVYTVHSSPAPIISLNGLSLTTGAYASYQWTRNNVLVTGATGATFTPSYDGVYRVNVTDQFGCSGYSQPYSFNALGSTGAPTEDGIYVYPNPATESLRIVSPVPLEIAVFSADGREVLRASGESQIRIAALADGVYLIRMSDRTGKVLRTQSFTKKTR